MNFFKQPEIDILNNYPLYQIIQVSDYLCDFVLKNPLNYPYSSSIMKLSENSNKPLKEQYTRENILQLLKKNRTDASINEVYHNMLHSKNPCFTALLLCLFSYQDKCKFIIHQKSPNIIISINDGRNKHLAMIDFTASTLLCYHSSDIVSIYQMFNNEKNWNSVAEISSNFESSKHYYFEFNDEDEILNILQVFFCITTLKPPSWYIDNFFDYIRYRYKENIMEDYNIMRLCDSFNNCVNDALVIKADKENHINHQQEVISSTNDLFNKTVVV